jgi:hypothetical protein
LGFVSDFVLRISSSPDFSQRGLWPQSNFVASFVVSFVDALFDKAYDKAYDKDGDGISSARQEVDAQ